MKINYKDMNVFMHRRAQANEVCLNCITHILRIEEHEKDIRVIICRKHKHQPEVSTTILDKVFKGE